MSETLFTDNTNNTNKINEKTLTVSTCAEDDRASNSTSNNTTPKSNDSINLDNNTHVSILQQDNNLNDSIRQNDNNTHESVLQQDNNNRSILQYNDNNLNESMIQNDNERQKKCFLIKLTNGKCNLM